MYSRLVALLIASTTAAPAIARSQGELDALADRMGARLTILDNKPADCPHQANGCFRSQLRLTMPSKLTREWVTGDFKIYFGSVSPVIEADSREFSVRLINGDLHVLEPRPGAHLRADQTYTVDLWSQGHFFSAYYPMPNMFIVSGDLAPRVIAATRPTTDPESGLEVLPFVAPMTDEARLATASADDETRWQTPEAAYRTYSERAQAGASADIAIIPTPAFVRKLQGPPVDLTRGVRLHLAGVERGELATALADLSTLGVREAPSGTELRIRIRPGQRPESYRLNAQNGAIAIDAADAAGALYALQSLSAAGRA